MLNSISIISGDTGRTDIPPPPHYTATVPSVTHHCPIIIPQCSCNVPIMSRQNPGNVPTTSQQRPNNIPATSWPHPSNVPAMFRQCHKCCGLFQIGFIFWSCILIKLLLNLSVPIDAWLEHSNVQAGIYCY